MLKIATVCSGIGAPEKALTLLGIPYELAFFSEIDTQAIRSYCAIHGERRSKNLGDLSLIDYGTLPTDIDLIVGGTPCQDFSTSGLGRGGEEGSGTRSSLMWHYVHMIEKIRPKVVVWENVAAVLSRNHIRTYGKFFTTILKMGYHVTADILNAKYFNLPQNRVRIFLIAVRKDCEEDFRYPNGYDSGIRIKDILENYVAEACFLKSLDDFQIYERSDMDTFRRIPLGRLKRSIFKQGNELISVDGIFDCLTTKPGNYILDNRIARDKTIRRLLPIESLRMMGFTENDYAKCRAAGVSDPEIYVQAGNSIAVPVLIAVFGQLYGVPWREKVFQERFKTDEQLIMELPLFQSYYEAA